MIASVFLLGIAVVLAVAAVGVSLFSAWRSQALMLAAEQRAQSGIAECSAANDALRKTVEAMAVQLRDLHHEAPATLLPGALRPGLNLQKRSQVLRMNRKGDPPDRIASALKLPLQEVDLLIKVHRIVMKSI
jgi:hypothetical protein